MSFKEKSAWLMFCLLSVTGLAYFYVVIYSTETLLPPLMPLIVVYTAALIALAVFGHILIALWNPKEANASRDERDRVIDVRSSHLSSYVLSLGTLLSLGIYLVLYDSNLLFYSIFASLMLSQIAEYLLQIFYHRKGIF